MTDQELQVATVRMRLFDAANADVLAHLETLTQLPREPLVRALEHALRHETSKSEPRGAAALTVFDLWLEWEPQVPHELRDYEKFPVFVRKRLEANAHTK